MTAPTIGALPAQLAVKEVSAEELARHYLSYIEAGMHLNTFIHIDTEATLVQARAADARIVVGNMVPLAGIPTAHKDVLVTRSWCVTAGSRMLGNYVSPFDATAVKRLGAAGMVALDRTNMDEFVMGSSNENSAFDMAKNPWNLEHVLGGSLGDSVAAVAVDLAPTVTGTDTGGSARQPALSSGIIGVKLTYSRVSRYGMIAFASSLDQGGPMAHTAEGCASLLPAMAGFDLRDSTSLEPGHGSGVEDFGRLLGQPLQSADVARPLAGLRTGLPKEYLSEGLADDVRATVRAALAELEELGATPVDISLPGIESSIPTYYVIAPAEASSNLSCSDDMCYGHCVAKYRDLVDMCRKSRAEGFGWEVKRRILVGAYMPSHGYYDAYYLQAQKTRWTIVQDFQSVLTGTNRQCDVIMGLAVPTVAWKLGEETNDPVQTYPADISTLSTGLIGLPGMSVPAGFGVNGLPISLQITGNHFEEIRTPQVAHALQQAIDWHHHQPVV